MYNCNVTVADPEVGTLGVLDIIQKKKKKKKRKKCILACLFSAWLFHTIIYVRARACWST